MIMMSHIKEFMKVLTQSKLRSDSTTSEHAYAVVDDNREETTTEEESDVDTSNM